MYEECQELKILKMKVERLEKASVLLLDVIRGIELGNDESEEWNKIIWDVYIEIMRGN